MNVTTVLKTSRALIDPNFIQKNKHFKSCLLADRPDKAWIQTSYKSASPCSKPDSFSWRVTCWIQWIFIDFDTPVMNSPLTDGEANSRGVFLIANKHRHEHELCGSVQATVYFRIYRARAVWTPEFFSTHTERTASGLWGDIRWIWQKVCWIRIADCTFKSSLFLLNPEIGRDFRRRHHANSCADAQPNEARLFVVEGEWQSAPEVAESEVSQCRKRFTLCTDARKQGERFFILHRGWKICSL